MAHIVYTKEDNFNDDKGVTPFLTILRAEANRAEK